jgi:hypothetical protein
MAPLSAGPALLMATGAMAKGILVPDDAPATTQPAGGIR